MRINLLWGLVKPGDQACIDLDIHHSKVFSSGFIIQEYSPILGVKETKSLFFLIVISSQPSSVDLVLLIQMYTLSYCKDW